VAALAELLALLNYIADHADRDTGSCTVLSAECLDAFEAASEVNTRCRTELLEVVNPRTVSVKDFDTLDDMRRSIAALHILESL
jgi:hypothetical protein